MIHFQRLNASHTLFPRVVELYLSAFPEVERRPLESWIRMSNKHLLFSNVSILDETDAFVGFITLWTFEKFTYIEHFALLPMYRGRGIGGCVLDLLQKQNPSIVLEVEPSTNDETRARIRFYEHHGFVLSALAYEQPSYLAEGNGLSLCLMSSGEVNLLQAKQDIYRHVYGK